MRFLISSFVISSVVVVRFSLSGCRFIYFFHDWALWDLMLAGPTGWVLISSVSSESSLEISKDSGVVVLSSKNEEGSDEAIVSLDHSEDDDDDDEAELQDLFTDDLPEPVELLSESMWRNDVDVGASEPSSWGVRILACPLLFSLDSAVRGPRRGVTGVESSCMGIRSNILHICLHGWECDEQLVESTWASGGDFS